MFGRRVQHVKRFISESRFLFVLLSILFFMILEPIYGILEKPSYLLDIASTLILISGVYAASHKRISRVAVLLAFPMLLTTWATSLIDSPFLIIAQRCSTGAFILFTLIIIQIHVIRIRKVTMAVIYGAIVVYFLIGFFFGNLFALMEYLHPGSFFIAAGASKAGYAFLYYSFVTLTTLGYGDFTPVTKLSRSLAVIEAVMGQLYIAVTIARLVGLEISQASRKESLPDKGTGQDTDQTS